MAHCNKCNDGINEDTLLTCDYCDGHGNIPDDDDIDYCDDDNFQPCDNCDLPDACKDYGCAIKNGIRKHPLDFL